MTVRWHHRSAIEIDHVITHPSDDTLALLQSTSPTSTGTRVLLFRPASAIPYKTHTIPFRFSNVIWYPTPASPSTNFSLVGITESWSVLLFGDDVQSPADDGASGSRIAPDTNLGPPKTSIFQQMFGISAFAGIEPPSSLDFSFPLTARDGKRSALAIFDAPAYLMPPLESLFEPLLGGFLQLRSETQATLAAGAGVGAHEDEEVQMEVDEDDVGDKPLFVGSRPERIVDGREMNDFVELFKHYGLTRQWSFGFILIHDTNAVIFGQLPHIFPVRIQTLSANGMVSPKMAQTASHQHLSVKPMAKPLPRRPKNRTSPPLFRRQRRSVKREKSHWEKPHNKFVVLALHCVSAISHRTLSYCIYCSNFDCNRVLSAGINVVVFLSIGRIIRFYYSIDITPILSTELVQSKL